MDLNTMFFFGGVYSLKVVLENLMKGFENVST